MFHICKKLLSEKSHSQLSCDVNHGFHNEHEKNLIIQFKLNDLTYTQVVIFT